MSRHSATLSNLAEPFAIFPFHSLAPSPDVKRSTTTIHPPQSIHPSQTLHPAAAPFAKSALSGAFLVSEWTHFWCQIMWRFCEGCTASERHAIASLNFHFASSDPSNQASTNPAKSAPPATAPYATSRHSPCSKLHAVRQPPPSPPPAGPPRFPRFRSSRDSQGWHCCRSFCWTAPAGRQPNRREAR